MMQEKGEIDIDYVANLARIELTAEEKRKFSAQLGDILSYFEKLETVDASDVEPTAHAFPVYNVWDEDVAVPGISVEEALRNSPSVRDDQVVVPKVVED